MSSYSGVSKKTGRLVRSEALLEDVGGWFSAEPMGFLLRPLRGSPRSCLPTLKKAKIIFGG
jgi:hypothetical protein